MKTEVHNTSVASAHMLHLLVWQDPGNWDSIPVLRWYTAHCKLHLAYWITQCTLNSVCSTVYTAQSKLNYALCNEHCTLHTAHFTLKTEHYTLKVGARGELVVTSSWQNIPKKIIQHAEVADTLRKFTHFPLHIGMFFLPLHTIGGNTNNLFVHK